MSKGEDMRTEQTSEETPFEDPVCKMTVTSESPYHCRYGGKPYYFCSDNCLLRFKAHPEEFTEKQSPSGEENAESSVIYTCPMHPEIRQKGPGSCPKCGMALEPVIAEKEEDNSEYLDMRRRFIVSVLLALPLFALAMTADLARSWLPDALSMHAIQWTEFLLATPVVWWCGWPFAPCRR